jgi:hypothetical protein
VVYRRIKRHDAADQPAPNGLEVNRCPAGLAERLSNAGLDVGRNGGNLGRQAPPCAPEIGGRKYQGGPYDSDADLARSSHREKECLAIRPADCP